MERRPLCFCRTTRHAATAAVLGLLVVTLPAPATASAIHSYSQAKVRTEASLGPAWARFLAGGPTLWAVAKAPRFPSNLVLTESNGVLVDTPFVQYLTWRRNLDPARFDFYHPVVGPELAHLATSGQSLVAPTTNTNPQAQTTVPEPGMLGIGLMLIGAGLAWQFRHGRATTGSRVET